MGKRGLKPRFTTVLYVNVEPAFYAQVAELAEACDMSISELCRRILVAQVAEAYTPDRGA